MFQTLSLGLNMDPAVLWYVEDIRDTHNTHTHRLSHQPKPRLSLNVNFFSFIALFTVGHGWCRWVQRISSPPKRWPAGSSWYWRILENGEGRPGLLMITVSRSFFAGPGWAYWILLVPGVKSSNCKTETMEFLGYRLIFIQSPLTFQLCSWETWTFITGSCRC